jgi:hypothetical protein
VVDKDPDANVSFRGLSLKLGPQFLTLVVVNMLVLGTFFWFMDARARHTAHIVDKLLESCPQIRSQLPLDHVRRPS